MPGIRPISLSHSKLAARGDALAFQPGVAARRLRQPPIVDDGPPRHASSLACAGAASQVLRCGTPRWQLVHD
eukprot:281834-Prymnesium_polylepis.1